MLPMVYVANNDQKHEDDPHPLDIIFQNPEHEQVLQAIASKNKNLIIIEGDSDSGVVTFMKHYASSH